jgi:hypothetical protein
LSSFSLPRLEIFRAIPWRFLIAAIASEAWVLRIIHQLPADDGVVLPADFGDHIPKPAGLESVLFTRLQF